MRDSLIWGYLGKTPDGKKDRMSAKLDRMQSLSGLILALFIVGHMFFTSSILFGPNVMYAETKIFEGSLFLDEPTPAIVSIAAGIIFAIFIMHAALAMRKFPYRWREYRVLKTHASSLGHTDTILWIVQALTGFIMFFIGSVHLYMMMTMPDKIGPYASSDRIYADRMVILYSILIICVVLHAMVGLYRLSMKWGIPSSASTRMGRKRASKMMWGAILFFCILGYSALSTYWKTGFDHRDSYGGRYVPSVTVSE